MNSLPESIATTSRAEVPSRSQPPPSDDFISASETRSLHAGSMPSRQRRLEAGDMISTDEAAEMTGTSRVTINAWIAKGRAIGLTQIKRGFRMPRWQFDSPTMWDAIPRISDAIGTKDGWTLLNFLETPLGALEGATPRQAIERGQSAQVIGLAARGD